MFKLDTKNHKPIQIEIDGKVFEVKKITNRVILRGLEISERMQQKDLPLGDSFRLLVEMLQLYLPMDADWLIDNLSPEECRMLMDNITAEMNKAMGAAEPPLASGPGGDSLPK